MCTDPLTIYVRLLNEGTDVLRPTTGVFVRPDAIRVEPTAGYDPDDEEWEFPPGSEVRCVLERRDDRLLFVAREPARRPAAVA